MKIEGKADVAGSVRQGMKTRKPVMKVELEFSNDYIANVICSGIEGGIGYWCKSVDYTMLGEIDALMVRYHQPLYAGGYIRFELREAHEGKTLYTMRKNNVEDALRVILEKYPHHFGACVADGDSQDAMTGDVLIQCALFGEIVYG